MNCTAITRRLAAALAGAAGAVLALSAAAPALAYHPPPHGGSGAATFPATFPPRPPGWNKHPPLGHVVVPVYKVPVRIPGHTVAGGGMPAWQITLLAAAPVLAAVVA